MNESLLLILSGLLFITLGTVSGFFLRIMVVERGLNKARQKVSRIIEDAEKQADKHRKQVLLETKQDIHNLKLDFDKQLKDRKSDVAATENKLLQREQTMDRRTSNLDKREFNLDKKEETIERRKQSLDDKNNRLDKLIEEQNTKLIEIARFSVEQARDLILRRVEDEMAIEIAAYIREQEENAKLEVDKKAKHLLSQAIQKYAQDVTSERTVSVVTLPNDEMKGRI
ncbi:MAG: DUF3552 domain-containing protein, partial [Candidatus Izimaplasma sp.]|nr:DUF3552 domain-containing protein [Candidatus Izimaplasma bacterium]